MSPRAQPVAIVGLALRVPGAETPDQLWQILSEGRSAITPLPEARRTAGFPPDLDCWGGFIEDADGFEPGFFGISPREASSMDPQQRFLLELSWNAIENAGLTPDALAGPRTGVFMGACHWDYMEMMGRSGDPPDAYMPTGVAPSILANRISYQFDFSGPSVSNDTACSSALVAVHQAVQALREGTCDAALAGAANLIWSPDHFQAFTRNGMLSKTGQSRAFDAGANGYVRGEGGVVVLLKTLDRAEADGDPIHAVIRAVGTNHGGRSSGLTVTNPRAQADLIVAVMTEAGVRPDRLDYVEAHGTGTPVGDPIEIVGLKRALTELAARSGHAPGEGRVAVGSVKTNIGHLEGAAGLAGIAKILCAMRAGTLPANAEFERPNPLLRIDGSPLRIASEPKSWVPGKRPRIAAVSSFGFGGTNAHAVLQDYRDSRKSPKVNDLQIVPLSARDERGLQARARALLADLDAMPDVSLSAIAWTLQMGRVPMTTRAAILCRDVATLRTCLLACAEGRPAEGLLTAASEQEAAETAPDLKKLRKWVRKAALPKIAKAWVAGADVDWDELGDPVPRQHLTGYGFARERHWFPSATPVLEFEVRNRSTLDRTVFTLTLPISHPLLRDHIIGGRPILPGTAILEAVRQAGEQALPGEGAVALTDVVWLRAAEPAEDGVTLTVSLIPDPETGQIAFRVETAAQEVCGKGHVSRAAMPESAAVPDPAGSAQGTEDSYKRLAAAGIQHGAVFRALTACWAEGESIVADLTLPEVAGRTTDQPGHPVLLDAALQAIAALPGEETPGIPFAADRVVYGAPVTDKMRAQVRRTGPRRFDVDLWREDGTLAVAMRGLVTRAIGGTSATQAGSADAVQLAAPGWGAETPDPLAQSVPFDLILCVDTGDASQRPAALQAAGYPIHALTADRTSDPALAARRLATDLTAVLGKIPSAGAPMRILAALPLNDRLGRMVSPLLHSLALENPRLYPRVIETDERDLAPRIAREAAFGGAEDVRISPDGLRLQRSFAPLAAPAISENPWTARGVYWITGGSGGLGRIMARHLLDRGASTVVLSGRRKPDAPDLPGCVSLPCDVTDPVALAAARARIEQTHGPLHGVIHAAGILRDGLAATKRPDDIAAVFAPKVEGLVALDAATSDCDLELFAVFSSIAAVHGAVGQSDYAAANGFMDGFLERRRAAVAQGRRKGRSLCMNWPLWSEGGMQVDDRAAGAMTARMGVRPLPTTVGLSIFDDMARGALPEHLAIGYGDAARIGAFLSVGDRNAAVPPAHGQPDTNDTTAGQQLVNEGDLRAPLLDRLRGFFAEVLALSPDKVRTDTPFDTYGFDSIIAVDMIERIEVWLSVSLPKTLFFEHVDLNGIADALLASEGSALTAVLVPPQAPVPTVAEGPAAPSHPVVEAAAVEGAPQSPVAASAMAAPQVQTGRDRHEIAVIGIGGRYPGAKDLDGFWQMIRRGDHAFGPIPGDRWPHEEIYYPERSVLGKSTMLTGSFLEGIDQFDPRYFNMSQADAEVMSPEVRLLLESAVQTFEDAGYSREALHQQMDADVGVLVGTMSNHYNLYGVQNMLTRGSRASGSYTGTMPNMISYFYGLTGPSLFLDTMCSASLTALDLAVRLLREGQCRMALAGGVNLLLHPFNMISSSQEHFTTNRAEVIRSFGEGADGTILGEGVGTALLKPLREAERDGDNIQAVILGTAMTNAGTRNGFTVPRPGMQAKAVRDALTDAGVAPETISYIETHGSGTKLGDPIEIAGLHEVFGRTGKCAIGSVKSNIAHLLAAAGIVGFTKVLMQMRHGEIAPSLHSQSLNPAIPFDQSPFAVQQELTSWERPVDAAGQPIPRRAGLTSIGAGGMNGHMILQEYRAPASPRRALQARPVVLSAFNPKAMPDVVAGLLDWIGANPDADLDAVAHTLAVGRTALRCRFACVATDLEELAAILRRWQDGEPGGWRLTEDVLAVAEQGAAPAPTDAETACAAFLDGQKVDWSQIWPDPPARISLPTYPFQRVRCWVEVFDDAPSVLRPEAFRRRLHPLIGQNVSDLDGVGFRTRVLVDDLLDYTRRVGGRSVLEPLALLDAAMAAFDLAKAGTQGVSEALWHGQDLAQVETLEVRVAEHGADHRVTFSADGAPLFSAGSSLASAAPAALPVCQGDAGAVDPAAVFAEAAVEFLPYGQPLASFACDAQGLCQARLGEPGLLQDHAARNVTLKPEVLLALSQLVQLSARQCGLQEWTEVALHRVAELGVAGQHGPVTELRGQLDLRDGRLTGQVQLLDGQGRVAGWLHGIETFLPAGTEAEDTTGGADTVLVLREMVAGMQKFDLAEVDTQTSFQALGFDSIGLAALTDAVNTRFGVNLTPAVFYDVETIAALAGALGPAQPRRLNIDPPRQAGTSVPEPSGVATASGATAEGPTARRTPGESAAAPDRAAAAPVVSPHMTALAGPDPEAMPIAITGMSGRYARAADLEAFATLLRGGGLGLSPLPLHRYSPRYAERLRAAGLPQEGGFLEDIAGFDAEFFQMSRAEAEVTDPQHRMMLECVWQVLEDAARPPAALDPRTGVFLGVSAQDYKDLMLAESVPPGGYMATGTSHAMLANRVSHLLDLNGPSEAIDTACSSSLVAVDRAVRALRGGECTMAIAGGANLALSLEPFAGPLGAGMLSPTSRCHTFSAEADGYVRGEGVGAVLLRPLADAVRDGDVIHAVILHSATNHGGRASSLTAPRTGAQAALIEAAMDGIDPASIQYVEAHGTGTPLGDPVEVDALKRAYGRLAQAQGRTLNPGSIALGSVKTSIGHLEAAAGIAGLQRVVLAMREKALPVSRLDGAVNPYLGLENTPFRLNTRPEAWPDPGTGHRRRGAVSSFGFGGANAHVVLDAAPERSAAVPLPEVDQVIVLSARSGAALRSRARALLDACADLDGPGHLSQIAWTLQSGREAMEHRAAFIARSMEDLRHNLLALSESETDRPGVWRGTMRRSGGFAQQRDAVLADPAADIETLARDWTAGATVDWSRLHTVRPPRCVLPGYPFERQPHWFSAAQPDPGDALLPRPASTGGTSKALAVLGDLVAGRTDVAEAGRRLAKERSET
ncbi:SDR family NAD(P)-dependent oxidoreductase [Antarctobacter jejuensis]|uniref:SDR family NAD(P)-dependent oxidoreductase n=1 Tax=Antarctobacter jejuensis TaxID=1439938 RepID=UPI003FD4A320